MKRLASLLLLGALSVLVLGSCQKDKDINPSYDPETNSIITNLVFNFDMGTGPMTRQYASDVQAGTGTNFKFRGLASTRLFPVVNPYGDGMPLPSTKDSGDNDIRVEEVVNLGAILGQGQLNPYSTGNKSNRILELGLPLEVNTLMFFGRAASQNGVEREGLVDVNATMDDTEHPKVDAIQISLHSRVSETTLSILYRNMDIICAVLNDIAGVTTNVNFWWNVTDGKLGTPSDTSTEEVTEGGKTYHHYNALMSWKEYGTRWDDATQRASLSNLGKTLGETYSKFATIANNNNAQLDEIRAGSASAILRTIADLYSIADQTAQSNPPTGPEYCAKQLAIAIRQRINDYFDHASSGAGAIKFKNLNVGGDTGLIASLTNNGITGLVTTGVPDDINDFPDYYNLPLGAAVLMNEYDKSTNPPTLLNPFIYQKDINVSAFGPDPNGKAKITDYCYPSELFYYGNSPIRINSNTTNDNQYPDGAENWVNNTNWANNTNWSGWSVGHVLSTTRSVAMKENIHYGSALLKVTVSYGSDELEDNNHYLQHERHGANEENNKINVQTGSNVFTLTGMIIGGQPRTLGFDCLNHNGKSTFNRMIYDSKIENGNIPADTSSGNPSSPNYTLVFDNYIEDVEQSPVYIALEFKNNGNDFWGMTNMIRKDGYFYIIGVIDPANAANLNTFAFPTNYTLPPYNADGTGKNVKRVFMQGHTTEVNFVLNKYSLQYAYLTVPDLRSSQISLGLSADLVWHTGLQFNNVTIGGDTQFGSTTTP